MREGWERKTLGSVAETRLGKTLPRGSGSEADGHPYLRNVNVQWGRVYLDDLNRMPFTPAEQELLSLRSGDILVCEGGEVGRLALLSEDLPGVFFQNALHRVRVTDPQVIASYLALALEHFVRSGGLEGLVTQVTIAHLNQSKLRALPLWVPPLAEQRRIVDLIGALDDTIAAVERTISTSTGLVQPLIDRVLVSDDEWPLRTLGEVGQLIRGKRFTKREYVPSGLGCIHYGQIHTTFGPVTTESVTFLPEEAKSRLRLADPGDVVIAATSEDLDDLGKATVWLGDEPVAVHDDCYIFKHEMDPVFASYLFASSAFQDQKVQYAAGMKVTRISGANLGKIEIPVPSLDVQRLTGEALRALEVHTEGLRAERDRLGTLRSNLLTALLSGEHEIPETYDEFIEEVA